MAKLIRAAYGFDNHGKGLPMRRFGRSILALSLSAVLAVGLLSGAAPTGARVVAAEPEPPPDQWRSYWVDAFSTGIYTPAQVERLVAEAKAVNANALIVQVGRWMDCFCNRSTFPRTHEGIAPTPYDPLDTIVEKGHAAGLEVHAWVNATPMWNQEAPPPQPDHVFNTHGESASGADRWLNRMVDGSEVTGETMRLLDPANPAAIDYVVEGIASIAREYDVDGVNLDFIRYPDGSSSTETSDWGYSETSLRRFREASGRTDTPAPADEEFSQWRRDQITAYVRRIYLTLYGVDRDDRLSINGITYEHGPRAVGGWENTRTYREVYQDWKAWHREGIVDTTVAMNYKRAALPEQRAMYAEWNEALADWQAGRQAVIGPALYLNEIDDSVAQARSALEPTAAGNVAAGWSGYSYAGPTPTASETEDEAVKRAERGKLARALTEEDPTGGEPLFGEPAGVPAMDWKERPTKGQLAGTLTVDDGTPLDQAAVEAVHLGSGERRTGRVSDGSGWFGYVDLQPGRWLVRVSPPSGSAGVPVRTVRVERGELATADFTFARTG